MIVKPLRAESIPGVSRVTPAWTAENHTPPDAPAPVQTPDATPGRPDREPPRAVVHSLPSGDGAPARIRGRLFPEPGVAPSPAVATRDLLRSQVERLHQRVEALEQRTGDHVAGASGHYAAHPLVAGLLKQGLRLATAARLLENLAADGYGPDATEAGLRRALTREMQHLLDGAAPRPRTGTLVLVGPSGAGKTSLALKLARHARFYGRCSTTILILQPDQEDEIGYHNPVELYRRFGLPVQCAANAEEVRRALERVQHFDQLLIDTPSMPVRATAARRMLLRLKHLLGPVGPLQVHLVLSTTCTLAPFDAAYIQRLPLRPDAASLTHLDETLDWGRITEWMLALQFPVQFASISPRVPDGVCAFSPSWFVEELMNR